MGGDARQGERDGDPEGELDGDPEGQRQKRITLNTAVRRRRTDRTFYIRLAAAIRENERALERLKR